MGLGTFETFLMRMHELLPTAAPDPSQEASASAPVIIAIARLLAQQGNSMPLTLALTEANVPRTTFLSAMIEGQKAGLFAIDPMPEPKLVLTPTGIPFAEV